MELTRVRECEAGFSAIETLIALLILTIGMSAVATGLTEGRRIAGEADQRQRAIALARDKITEKIARGYQHAASPIERTEGMSAGVLVGQDEFDGISRTWWVEPRWAAPGVARVFVVTQWTRRGERQIYGLAGLVAEGRSE